MPSVEEAKPPANRTHRHTFTRDLDLDPMTLIYDLDVYIVSQKTLTFSFFK